MSFVRFAAFWMNAAMLKSKRQCSRRWRRSGCTSIQDASQHARHRSLCAYRAGTLFKAAVVGGFEKVYELIETSQRGISTKHNPEFTMLEFYMAYADVNQMMDLHEEMMRSVSRLRPVGYDSLRRK